MGYELSFASLTDEQTRQCIDIVQKISAIEGELANISTSRAEAEAVWRKKENYLQTEKGKLEISLRTIRTGNLKEV